MKRLFFIFGGLMLLALAACVNEKISIEDQFAGEKITVKAYMPEGSTPSTRVSYTFVDDNNPETNDPFMLSWSVGDAFSVIRGGVNKIFSNSDGTNDFTGDLPTAGSGDYYAVYPAIAENVQDIDTESVPFNITNQDNLPYLMYASSDDGKSFKFHHALAYLKLTISLPDNDDYLLGKPAQLSMMLPGAIEGVGYSCAAGSLNISSGDLIFISHNPSNPNRFISKSVTFPSAVRSLEVMFAIPPTPSFAKYPNQNKLEFVCTTTDDNITYSYSAVLPRTGNADLVAGHYYTADITLEKVENEEGWE